jgi:hypothetical protein
MLDSIMSNGLVIFIFLLFCLGISLLFGDRALFYILAIILVGQVFILWGGGE